MPKRRVQGNRTSCFVNIPKQWAEELEITAGKNVIFSKKGKNLVMRRCE